MSIPPEMEDGYSATELDDIRARHVQGETRWGYDTLCSCGREAYQCDALPLLAALAERDAQIERLREGGSHAV